MLDSMERGVKMFADDSEQLFLFHEPQPSRGPYSEDPVTNRKRLGGARGGDTRTKTITRKKPLAYLQRAGTKLDLLTCEQIEVEGGIEHGFYDSDRQLFQKAIHLQSHVHWPTKLLSLGLEEMNELCAREVERVEFVDAYDPSEVYRCEMDVILSEGREFNHWSGPRWGVHLDCFRRYNTQGGRIS